MNGLAICAGIGALELGVSIAVPAYKTVVAVEIEAYAVAVLVTRQQEGSLPPFPIWDNLSTFDGKPWCGIVDCIVAGLPCQPYSCAGKRQGDRDERYIWPDFFRIASEVQPALVFLENVPGLLRWFRPIGEELCRLGYEFEAGLFTAAEVGASHKRERLFVLAYYRHETDRRLQPERLSECCEEASPRWSSETVADAECQRTRKSEQGVSILDECLQGGKEGSADAFGCREVVADASGERSSQRGESELLGQCEAAERSGDEVAHARCPSCRSETSEQSQIRPRSEINGNALADSSGEQMGTAGLTREDSGLTIFAPGPSNKRWAEIIERWPTLKPAIRRVAHGNSNRLDQLRAVGNAVVPLVAAHAFRTLWSRIYEIDGERSFKSSSAVLDR